MEKYMNGINYSKYFVAFLDVLGFTKMIYDNDLKKVNDYLRESSGKIDSINSSPSKHKVEILTISDSIILAIPTDENEQDRLHNLRQLCICVLALQQALLKSEIFLRGAISVGDLYINIKENQIIGKAYIQACELEKTMAKYPRVILDNKIIEFLNLASSQDLIQRINQCNSQHILSYEDEVLYDWDKYGHLLEKDVPLFIDYLNTPYSGNFYTVCQLIQKNAMDIKVYDKHLWLSKYLISKTKDTALINKLKNV